MKKLLLGTIVLILSTLSCTEKTTKVIYIGKQRPPKCVHPPHGNNKMAIPRLPSGEAIPSPLARMKRAGLAPAVTDFKILVLLVDFPDKPFRESPAYFDRLFFDDTGHTVKTYYKEQSNGAFNAVGGVLPSQLAVLRLPNSYSYYTNGNYGFGGYPSNAQKMAQDAIQIADPLLDFSQYDNDGDGRVDGVIIVHAGSGAELTGNVNDIWSHAWDFPALTVDGKTITDYCTVPEYWTDTRQMQIGVIVHEAGHLYFNQLDEYGTCGTWQGLGRHCGMASGSYNGRTGLGDEPAPFCAPSKVRAGFATPIPIDTAGYYAVPLGSVLRYGTGSEVIYAEQRQRRDFDQPGSGLLFIHGKATIGGMCYRWYPGLNADVDGWGLYQLIQADGLFELEKNLSGGDGEDYWPGPLGKTILDSSTSPTSNWYFGTTGIPSGFNLSHIATSSFVLNGSAPPPPPSDTLICPADIEFIIKGKGQTGKVVSYATPLGAICTPPSGYKFPVGQTLVACTSNDDTCTFTVTVTRAGK